MNAESAQASPASPATPIRFGIVDIWLLLLLIGLHLGPLFYSMDIHHSNTNARAIAATALCVAVVGGAAYLAHRKATELETPSPLLRIVLTLAFEIMLFIAVGTVGAVAAALHFVGGSFGDLVAVMALLFFTVRHFTEKLNEQPPRWFKRGPDG